MQAVGSPRSCGDPKGSARKWVWGLEQGTAAEAGGMKVGGRRSQGSEMKIQSWMRERLEACQEWTLWASQEVTEVVGIVTEPKSHGGGYGQEWTWRCGARVLLSSRGCTEIDGGTQQLGNAGSLAGLGGACREALALVEAGEAVFVLTACGCATLRRTAAPTRTDRPGRLERAAAPGTDAAVPCAPPPPAAAPSCSVATQLRAWRRVGGGTKRGCHLQLWGSGQSDGHSFIHSRSSYGDPWGPQLESKGIMLTGSLREWRCLSRGSAATGAAEWLGSAESERSESTLLFPT